MELVIFDVDGLMIDSERVWQKAYDKAGEYYGYKNMGNELFLKVIGVCGNDLIQILKENIPGNTGLLIREKAKQFALQELSDNIPLKEGLIDLLYFLKSKKIKMAVATTTDFITTKNRLTKAGIYEMFDEVVCGDQVKNRKPNPEIYDKVVSRMNIKKENILVLEDSYVGVQAAYNANIPVIMVPDLMEPTEIQINQSKCVLKNLKQVQFYIEEELSKS